MSALNNKELAENKLILLYIIDIANMPISNLQITKIILENQFMNYFIFQQFLNELCDVEYLSSEVVDNKTYYSITASGKQTLSYFTNHIPIGIKNCIDRSITDIRKRIKTETLVKADYTPESESEFIVKCQVREDNFSLIDLEISVGTKSDCRTICENWKKYSHQIYSEILESLIRKRD
ncbi:DUF4364 family protein [Acetivibrio cellulolyticus]|uniref:DUF4364 family protein n=1 Tax=Acetivibrio cellulolyticus TaxID=35830 RepID=UPI0001E2E787|nr:DUF4364 family protein [Acetivibrio cellulolyticus]